MYTERQAIQDDLHNIRRQLEDLDKAKTALYEQKAAHFKRLRELDERDMGNKVSYDALNSLTEKMTESVSKIAALIPPVEVAQVIEHISKDVNKDQIIPVEKTDQPKEDKKAAQIQEEIKKEISYTPPREKISRERTVSMIKEILIDNGEPMKAKALEKEFYKRTNGRQFANFYEQIKFAQTIFPGIQKVGRGTYIYKTPHNIRLENKEAEESVNEEENTNVFSIV